MVPYLDLVTKNGLAVSVAGEVTRYRTTAKGEEALRHSGS
jgi:DNA-binding PadR family transcriptional regulator